MAKAVGFLQGIKPYLATNECRFEMSAKNIEFDNYASLTHEQKVKIIKSLTACDCVKIEPNSNPRYVTAEVYVFIRSVELTIYGEKEELELYIKMYYQAEKNQSPVIVISFHRAGVFD